MKKFVAIILLIILLVTCASCQRDINDESLSVSAESDFSTPSEYVVPHAVKAINNMLVGDIDRTLTRSNFLKGVPYKSSVDSGDKGSYVDRGGMLTDGIAVGGFDTYNWVGFVNKSRVEIVFDFGEKKSDIADVEIGLLSQLDYGIGLPDYAELYFSNDGTDYTRVSRVEKPSQIKDVRRYSYNFYMQNSVSAQYMKLVFARTQGGFIFVDEISAYTYSSENTTDGAEKVFDYYPSFNLSEAADVYWDKSEKDFNEKQNLALNKPVYISAFTSLLEDDCIASLNSPIENAAKINDGKYVNGPAWDNPNVFRFTRGDGRSIIIDLEKISAVESASGEFIAHTSWGVYPATAVGFSASVNGYDWQGIGSAEVTYDKAKDAQSCKFTANFEGVFKARFIKVTFLCPLFRAVGEIEIFGTKSIPSAAKTPNPNLPDITKLSDSFKTPEEFSGIDNIMCTPVCIGDGVIYDDLGMVTVEEFLPYVGYYENGEIKDTFINTYLFSPCSGFTKAEDRIRFDGWKFYLNSQFIEGTNILALNDAIKIVSEALDKNDYKANIFMSLLRPVPYVSDGVVNTFGDIDGDGKDDPLDKVENRKKALKWMVDTQLEMLDDANLDKINLVGFYWQEEFINSADPFEVEAFEYIRDYVHSKGYKIIWIPYYRAQSFDLWKDFGFDLACLQPNYAFDYTSDAERLVTTAYQARLHGMSVELEINTYTNLTNIVRYKRYLEYGVKYGYMDAVKVYYHNVIPSEITNAMNDPDPYTASVYKDTYLFSKGLLDKNYSYISYCNHSDLKDMTVIIAVTDKKHTGKLTLENASGYEISLSVSPKYGNIEMNPNGTYSYRALKGFEGQDYFCAVAKFIDGFEISFTVNINVE